MFARSYSGILVSTTVALVATCGSAFAQVQPVTPYYAMITGDSSTLRSAPTSNAYSVATIPQSAVVIVDGETQGWTRVLYPSGLHAFVPATAGTVQGEMVTLSRPDELFAASQLKGWGGSWKALLDNPLPAGTTLPLVETVKDGETPIAYKVIAPNEARGYVGASALRKATDTEVEAYKAKGNALATLPAAAAPIGPTTTTNQATAIDVPKDQILLNPRPAPTTVLRDTNKPTTTTIGAPTPTTPNTTNPSTTIATQPTETKAESLEKTFTKVWKEPVLTSEVDELIGEYDRAIAEEKVEGRKHAMTQRLEALKLRRDYRESLRRLEAERTTVDARQTELNKQLEEWATNRVYTIVGVLQPSTVYDGSHLPSMYRVVSVGGSAPRTLGYIKKSDDLDLDKYMGMIVGVIGERSLDQSLQLNLINPVRVDPLRSSANLEVPLATTPAPAPTTVTTGDETIK